jgi:hypothetical protein
MLNPNYTHQPKELYHLNIVSAQFIKLIGAKKPKELHCFKTIQKIFALCLSDPSFQSFLIFVLLICLSVFFGLFSFIKKEEKKNKQKTRKIKM